MKWFFLGIYILIGLVALGAALLTAYYPPATADGLSVVKSIAGIAAFTWGIATLFGAIGLMVGVAEGNL